MDDNSSRVRPHGPVDGERDRRVVWPLAGPEEIRHEMARHALTEVLSRMGMNGHTPELVAMPGSMAVNMGHVAYEAAAAIAQNGIEALDAAEQVLRQQIIDGEVDAGAGVGISAGVVTFPDQVK